MSKVIETLRRIRHTAIPLPLKYGPRFRQVFAFLQQHQHAGRDELESYQWERLVALLEYAYRHVPFYHRRFTEIGMQPGDIKNRDDFRKIPILTKDDVEDNLELLKSDEFERLVPIETVTSGTTRDHLKLFRSAETEVWRNAMVWRHYFNIGYHFRDPRVRLTAAIKYTEKSRLVPIDYNENEMLLNPRLITLENCPEVYRIIKQAGTRMISFQASNLALLVEQFRERKLEPFTIPIIYNLGEKLYDLYREPIVDFFRGQVYDYYANRENTAAACQMPDGRSYIQSDYCYLEFIDDESHAVSGKQADIVSTSLINYAFPLIRYNTEDLGIDLGYPEGAKWNFPTMQMVGGRGKDLLLTRDGLSLPYAFSAIKNRGFDRFRQIQVEQLSLDALKIKIVPSREFRQPEDHELLQSMCDEVFAPEFKVKVEIVEQIPSTENCKYKLVVSDLALNYLKQKRQK